MIASRPAASAVAGKIYIASDTLALSVSDGTNWIDTWEPSAAVSAVLGLTAGGVTRRGKSIIATEEARTNVAYGKLTTPDEVTVTLPTDGLIVVLFQAQWKESVSGAGRGALFLGANQLKIATDQGSPEVTQVKPSGPTNTYRPLHSAWYGLGSSGGFSGSDVTTGQVVGSVGASSAPFVAPDDVTQSHGGACPIFAAAGTYTVSVQFKSTSGTVTVKERKLWVRTEGY